MSPGADQDARERWARVEAELDALLDSEPPGRAERLQALEAAEPELAAELRGLLEAEARAGAGFLESWDQTTEEFVAALAGAGPGDGSPTGSLAPGERVGAWRVGALLGSGGMGEVFEALRADGAFEQDGALKLLRRGLDSEQHVQRFLAERQILAQLDHPHVARLLDGGLAPDGRPFLVLERVEGQPITEFCRRQRSSVETRLRLALDLCAAVEAAHRRLVVHRDIKPSNVLVTPEGRIKLLDFGIAKLLAPDPDVQATHIEARVLTPAYAAPEQVLGQPVTTATDVYQLGALLYELLAEANPHRRAAPTLARLTDEVGRETIERPSSARRRLAGDREADRAARRLEGDLDVVLLKALQREPERRYASVAALADDLRRHLEGRPVLARADSLRYRTVKFVRRHRWTVAATALVLVSLAVGLGSALVQGRRAVREARRAERVKALLVEVFQGADPERARGGTITARELLEEGTRKVEKELGDDPEVQAELLTTVAQIEDRLGLLEPGRARAERALLVAERAWGPRSPRLLEPLSVLGGLLLQLERSQEALAVKNRALALARAEFAADTLEVARAELDLVNGLFGVDRYAEALPLAEHVLGVRRRVQGEHHLDTVNAKLVLAFALDFLDRPQESIALGREVLLSLERTLGPDDPRTLEARHNLAVSLGWVGQNREAAELFAQAIAGRRRVLGAGDFRLAYSLQQSSLALRDLERYDQADAATCEAIAIFEALDPRHPEAVNGRHSLAASHLARGDFAGAAAEYRRAATEWEAERGPEHRSTLQARANLALAEIELGHLAEAERLARETLAGRQRAFGENSAYVAHSWLVLGDVERALGRTEAAVAAHERSRAVAAKLFGEAHTATVRAGLGLALDELGRGGAAGLEAAERALARASVGQRALDPEHSRLAEIDLALARLALARGQPEVALARLTEARARVEKRLGAGSYRLIGIERLRVQAQALAAGSTRAGEGGSRAAPALSEHPAL